MAPFNAIQHVCDLVGGQSALARLLSTDTDQLTPQAIQYWCRKGRVPAERVLAIEAVVEGQVSRYELRPDLYPRGGLAA